MHSHVVRILKTLNAELTVKYIQIIQFCKSCRNPVIAEFFAFTKKRYVTKCYKKHEILNDLGN